MSSSSTPNPAPEPKAEALGPDKTLLEQMNSEYGILQDKLDKIGGFRTTIRGWSVTLVIASIIAAGSSKQVSPYFLSLLFVFIYLFHAMEQKQNQFGNIFGSRVLHLEKRMREEMKALQGPPILGFYPGIAHHLHTAMKRKSPWFTDPDRFFYIAQGAAVAITMLALALLGPTSKPPEVQNIIQMESTPSEVPSQALGTGSGSSATSEVQRKQEQKNVKENTKKTH